MGGELARLAEYLCAQGRTEVDLRFSEVERVIGGALPPEAWRSTGWWLAGSAASDAWESAGWTAKPRVARGVVTFMRKAAERNRP